MKSSFTTRVGQALLALAIYATPAAAGSPDGLARLVPGRWDFGMNNSASAGGRGFLVFTPETEGSRAGAYQFVLKKGELWTITAQGSYAIHDSTLGAGILQLKPSSSDVPDSLEAWELRIIHNTGIVITEDSQYVSFPQDYPEASKRTLRLCHTELRADKIKSNGCDAAWSLERALQTNAAEGESANSDDDPVRIATSYDESYWDTALMRDPYADKLQQGCRSCAISPNMMRFVAKNGDISVNLRWEPRQETGCLHRSGHLGILADLRPKQINVWGEQLDLEDERFLISVIPTLPVRGISPAMWGIMSKCDNGAFLTAEMLFTGPLDNFDTAISQWLNIVPSAQINSGSFLAGDWVRSGEELSMTSDGHYTTTTRVDTFFSSLGTYQFKDGIITFSQVVGLQGKIQRRCKVQSDGARLDLACDDGKTRSYAWRIQ